MKSRTYGFTQVDYYVEDEDDWYVVVTPPYAAVCNCRRHEAPHLHAHPVRSNPRHKRVIPVARTLTLEELRTRLEELCTGLSRGPELEELRKVLE